MAAQLLSAVNEELEERKPNWTTVQLDLAARAIFVDSDLTFQVTSDGHKTHAAADDYRYPRVSHAIHELAGLTCVGGLDISFVPGSAEAGTDAIATLAVLDFPELNVRAASSIIDIADFSRSCRSSTSSRAGSP